MHESIGATLGGIVAGEGCFCVSSRGDNFVRDGSARLRFIFTVTMASRDRPILEALHQFLGAGRLTDRETRAGCLPTSVFDIRSEKVHTGVVIPFAERFLPPFTAKYRQFASWRDRFDEYIARRPSQYGRGPSQCAEPDCNKPVRGRGLCRSHYYRVSGY